jgi:hypothetical protein
VHGRSHQRLAGAGGRIEDDVAPLEQGEDGLLLRGVQLEALRVDQVEEAPEERVGVVVGKGRDPRHAQR